MIAHSLHSTQYNEDRENNDPPMVESQRFIEKALKFLVPLLTTVLTTKVWGPSAPFSCNSVSSARLCGLLRSRRRRTQTSGTR